MANKPAPKKNWNDVQVAIAVVSMATTLAAWNLFAGPDRASAMKRAEEQSATLPPPTPTAEPTLMIPTPVVVASPTSTDGKVYFGGVKPQTVIVVQGGGGGGGGGGGCGGGGGGGGGAAQPPAAPPPAGGGSGGS